MDDLSQSRETYLIAVKSFVILQDLADTVREFDRAAHILGCGHVEELPERLALTERVAIVFAEAGPRDVAALCLDEAVRMRGGRLVLLGDDAEDEWDAGPASTRRWPTLLRPFNSQSVLSLILAGRG